LSNVAFQPSVFVFFHRPFPGPLCQLIASAGANRLSVMLARVPPQSPGRGGRKRWPTPSSVTCRQGRWGCGDPFDLIVPGKLINRAGFTVAVSMMTAESFNTDE
jgi:hypothetical protein